MSKHGLLATAIVISIFSNTAKAQPKTIMQMQATATKVFNAWQQGEAGNGYGAFKLYLDEVAFRKFSHPLVGNHRDKDALDQLHALIKEREAKPNQLQFSNVITYSFENKFCFQFDSEGKVSGGFPYKGYNIIQLEIKDDKLVGFREYFGFVDPAWFK